MYLAYPTFFSQQCLGSTMELSNYGNLIELLVLYTISLCVSKQSHYVLRKSSQNVMWK